MLEIFIIVAGIAIWVALLLKHSYPYHLRWEQQNRQKVICFSGQKNNGKDSAADYLAKRLNGMRCGHWHRVAFGDGVKNVFMRVWGGSRAWLEEWKRKDNPPPGFDQTVRQALMFIGDGFRQIQPMIWIDKLYRDNSSGNLVISDGRYDTELASAKERGGMNILVWRPGHENDIKHNSESQLVPHLEKLKKYKSGPVNDPDIPFDWFLINDGSMSSLCHKIDSQLIPHIKKRFEL